MTGINRMTGEVPAEERKALLAQFQESGLEYQQFAKEHNVNENAFRNWIWLEKNPGRKHKRFSPTERKKTVEAYLSSGMTMTIFAKTWGIGLSTLSKWVERYQDEGSDGLMDRPVGPRDGRRGMKVPLVVQNEILAAKRSDPSSGLMKIKNWLRRNRGMNVSKGSIRKTVVREGLPLAIKPRKKKRSSDRIRRFERARPMQLWQSDITQFTLGPSSMRVYLTVFMDDHSRYIVGWRLMSRQTADLVIDSFKDAMVRFGKPEEVLTDQGRQYFAWRGKSELEKLLENEGIKHVVSRAHHPQTLGKCERFWETVGNEFWTRAKPQDLEEARVRLKYFIDHYNHQRPHQGIDGMTPADRFFGVAEQVREIVEKTIEENSIRLSLGEIPRPPAFLIGQVGDQKIAFHGTSGNFYLTNENINGDENGSESANRSVVSQFAINRDADRNTNRGGAATDTNAPAAQNQTHTADQGHLSADLGAGSVGASDGRRSWTSEACGGENIGDLGGVNVEGGGSEGIGNAAHPILANEQSGYGRNDGGIINAATVPHQASGEWNDGARRDYHVTQDGAGT